MCYWLNDGLHSALGIPHKKETLKGIKPIKVQFEVYSNSMINLEFFVSLITALISAI